METIPGSWVKKKKIDVYGYRGRNEKNVMSKRT